MEELLSLYHFIPADQKQFLKSKTELKEYKKGDFLLFEGDVQNKLYLVKQGILMLYYDTDKKIKVMDFAYLNRFCVDIDSFTNQTPSSYCIQCIDDCSIEIIDYPDLQNVFDQCPDIERAYRLLTEKILSLLVKRLLNQRISGIEQRFFQVMHKRPELFKLVPHKYIASYIDIDPTNFSKLFNQYCTNGKLYFT